ncbi:MAG: hydroxyacylglutathione hydrolase [Alphaproteobacteria bacterium]
MSQLEVYQFACLSDNYGVLLHDPASGATAAIDAPDADAVTKALAEKSWSLTHILVTHHHWDHTQGIDALKKATGCQVVGPKAEADKVPGLDTPVGDADSFDFAGHRAMIIGAPGHTLGHIVYWFEGEQLLFAGDALFALGCGRMFEGDADQMWGYLDRLRKLPGDTKLYCGHEYTLANARFAVTIEPGNTALAARLKDIEKLRDQGLPTVPSTLGVECETNPFMRPDSNEVQATLDMQGKPLAQIFAEVRRRKDAA